MSEKTVKIILKKNYEKPREISVGNKTVKAAPGEPLEVALDDLQLWLNTRRFEVYQDSDLPLEIPARAILEREGLSLTEVSAMDKTALEKINGIGRNLADAILMFLHPETETEENGGNE